MRLRAAGLIIRTPRSLTPAPPDSAVTAAVELPVGEIPWSGVLVVEGVETGDERIIERGALTWAELPLPLTDNHDPDAIIGRIDTLRRDGDRIVGTGVFDDSPAGREAARQVAADMRRGLSIDLDMVDGEIVIETVTGPDGEPLNPDEPEPPEVVIPVGGDLFRVMSARIRGAALATIAAFVDAQIRLGPDPLAPVTAAGGEAEPCEDCDEEMTAGQMVQQILAEAPGSDLDADGVQIVTDPLGHRLAWPVVHTSREPITYASSSFTTTEGSFTTTEVPVLAAAEPVIPPADWFEDPHLDGPTPLTITDDGRVFGHAATWGLCHTGLAGRCVTAPRSPSGYAYFMTGSIRTSDGTRRCGQLTMSCGHAPLNADARAAAAHYDGGPGAVQWADVAAGEDAHGIWVAGAVRPGLSDRQLREASAQALSGDWRNIGGALELVAALSVPVPGYPVISLAASAAEMPAVRARVDGEQVLALVAAGRVLPVPPWEAALRAMAARLTEIEGTVARLRAITKALTPMAGDLLAERFNGNTATTAH